MDSTAEDIGRDLVRLLRLVARLRHQPDGAAWSGGFAHVVGLLVEKGPQRVGELAAALCADPSTVSRKVAALVDAGFVERRPDPEDGRAHLLAATGDGERQLAAGRRHRDELVATVIAGWPDDARRQLAALLGRFADGLQEHDRRLGRRPGGES